MYEIEESNYPTFKAVGNALWRAPGWLGRGVIRVWRRVWRFVLALLALLILAHLILNIVAGRRLEAELNRIRAAGQPLTLAEAAPPPVPDAQNAAVLYQQAFDGLSKPEADEDTVSAFLQTLPEKPRPTLAEVEAVLARHEADFRLLEEASRRPACRFPVNWKAGWAALFPHLGIPRTATRFLLAKALAEAERGRTAEALNDLAIEVRVVNHIGAEPSLIAQLVRVARLADLFDSLPDALAAAPPSATDSRALYDLLGQVDIAGPFARAIATEQAFVIAGFEQLRRAGPLGMIVNMPSAEDPTWVRVLARGWPVIRWVWEPFLKLDEVYFLRHMQDLIAVAAASPPRRMGYQKLADEASRAPWYAIVSKILAAFVQLPLREDHAAATVAVMRGALALRAYQIEHGDYPASLAELRARGGWAIPNDPCSSKPFIYRREGKGYLLYSVGPDGIDNGGISQIYIIKKAGRGPSLEEPQKAQYDIPLRMTR
jgi:hypothetical protein